jgi:hypothetical protein
MESKEQARGVRDWERKARHCKLGPGSWGSTSRMALCWLLTWGSLGIAGQLCAREAGPDLRITVRVHDYTSTQPDILARAEREATRVFAEAGVELEWQSYSPQPEETQAGLAPPVPAEVPYIHLSLVARSNPYTLAHQEETLGITPMTREGERCLQAEIFLDRVRSLAHEGGVSTGVLLGHAIAHEIGHILLRTSGHTSRGLMRARWTREDLCRAAQGGLTFSRTEGQAIRAEARARAQLDGSDENLEPPPAKAAILIAKPLR